MSVGLEPQHALRKASFPGAALIWVHIVVAALAMVATLPGRSHGLGLVTEPLLADLHLGRVEYGSINFWGTLLGAAFCLPCGWLIDRLGVRAVLTATLLALGGVVIAMSRVAGEWTIGLLFLTVLLTRGLGQSALSVVSLTLMGRASVQKAEPPVPFSSILVAIGFMAFRVVKIALVVWSVVSRMVMGRAGGRTTGPRVAVYSILVAVGFMVAFGVIKVALQYGSVDWRTLWAAIGVALLVFGSFAWLTIPPLTASPAEAPEETPGTTRPSLTFGEALRTPAFWAFALPCSFYLLVTSGISLFGQSVLEERGFDRDLFLTITMISPFIGLAGNLATGLAAARWSFGRLLAVAMTLFAVALAVYPLVNTLTQVYAYAITLAAAGGMITVIFFGVWGQVYGPAHLGKIQGAAQMLTVFASSAGPLALAYCHEQTGSYVIMFEFAAVVSVVMAVYAWSVRTPRREGMVRLASEFVGVPDVIDEGLINQPESMSISPENPT